MTLHALVRVVIVLMLVLGPLSDLASSNPIDSGCTFEGVFLAGKVQVVEHFPDFRVQIVTSFPDLKVQRVDHFPDDCGQWQFVEHFPDFKVQFVESFGDFKIQFVDHFPGLN